MNAQEILAPLPERKIEAIKNLRAETGMGVKEAKDAIDHAQSLGYDGGVAYVETLLPTTVRWVSVAEIHTTAGHARVSYDAKHVTLHNVASGSSVTFPISMMPLLAEAFGPNPLTASK